MKLCILDAWQADDPALMNSHWVAERTVIALKRDFPDAAIEVVAGDEVDGPRVTALLQQDHLGFAYFGHGRKRVLFRFLDATGEPVQIVGVQEVQLIQNRWFHAFACWSGDTLCHDAMHSGAAAYLGYVVPLVLEWDDSSLPDELRVLLERLVTVATLLLAHGERSRDQIRRRVRAASDDLVDWVRLHAEAHVSLDLGQLMGLLALASTLYWKLEMQGTAVVE